MDLFHCMLFSFKNCLYRAEDTKRIHLQTSPVFTLITLITRKKLTTIKMKRKQNKLNQMRDKNGKSKWPL